MRDESKHAQLREPEQIELVKCNTCHAAITPAVDRCPYCGQITTGTERRVSKLELDLKRRERLADKRSSRQVCKLCSNPVAANAELCSACESRDKRKRLWLLITVVAFVMLLLWFLSSASV